MPYIKQSARKELDPDIDKLSDIIKSEGDLNYAITRLCLKYINHNGLCYAILNEVHGVLSCADKELYRRLTAKYEDKKILENGDVEEYKEDLLK